MTTPLQQAVKNLIDRWNSPIDWPEHLALRKALDAELHVPETSFGNIAEPVAEVIECQIMGQQTVREIEGRWKFLQYGDKLYLHPPQQVAVTSGERAELIQWLRKAHEVFGNKNSKTIADMLEADDAFRPDWVNYRQGVKDGKADAQQAKPMTGDEIKSLIDLAFDEHAWKGTGHLMTAVARAAEQHHGIGGEA